MSTTVVPPQPEAPAFDSKAQIAARNAADQAKREGKEPPKDATKPEPASAPESPKLEPHEQTARQSRSWNRLQRKLGEETARREILEKQVQELSAKGGAEPAKAAADTDPEPQRKDFPDDNTYWRAVGRWDARQEAGKLLNKAAVETDAQRELSAQVDSAREKFSEDVKLLSDWDEVQKAAVDDADAPQFKPVDHPGLMMLIATSDVQAAILYWLAKHPDDMQGLLDLTNQPVQQIQKFRRLEGRAERLLDKEAQKPDNSPQKPAQGSGKGQEDRKHPAEEGTPSGRNGQSAAERDALKPRPTAEVAARGGSAPPDMPPIGSKAWMELRNAAARMPR